MHIKVVYISRGGNTAKLAQAIAGAVGTTAEPADTAVIREPVDVLFVVGSIYAGGLDKRMKSFLEGLSAEQVRKVAVCSSAASGKSARNLVVAQLHGKSILVAEREFSCRGSFLLANMGRPNAQDLQQAAEFAVQSLADA